MNNMIGKMLDNRYELLEVIGSGGMAVVYKAKCHRLNRLVAVKVLKSDLAEDADFRRRFRDESQAVAMLSHPNIVSVYDVSRGETEYIVMELIDGITLKQYMEKRGQLNWRESLHFITQIMRGLSHAHSRGIIHRDIKPANIFLSAADDFKLGDFGVARVTNAATAAYTRVGTLNYMAPEIFAGQPYSSNVDIYSLGLVMYQLLNANRMPFYPPYPETITYAAQERAHARRLGGEKLPAPANAPEHLAKIVLRACAPNPADRYQTAAQMRQELEALQKQEPAASGNTIVLPDPVSPEPDPTTKTVVLPDPSKKEPKPEGPTSTAPTKKVKPKATAPDEPKKKKISRRQLLAALGGTAAVAALAVGVLGRKSSSGPGSGVSGNSGECGENAEWNNLILYGSAKTGWIY